MNKIPIIVNPYSRRNKKMKGDAAELFKKTGGDFVEVKNAGDLQELDNIAGSCKEKSVPFIAISGGDGTIHQVISRFINIYEPEPLPPLLVLKDGTMNNISGTIGSRGSGITILKRFIKIIQKQAQLVLCTRNTMKIEKRYCFLFGMGFTTNILNAIYEGDKKDIPKVVRVIIKAFSDGIIHPNSSELFNRFRAKVFMNQAEIPCNDLLGILAGTVEDVGMGFKPLLRSDSGERTFHVIATGIKPYELAKMAIIYQRKKSFDHPLHYDGHVKELKIISDTSFEYTMDGDLYMAEKELTVEIGPEVHFICV